MSNENNENNNNPTEKVIGKLSTLVIPTIVAAAIGGLVSFIVLRNDFAHLSGNFNEFKNEIKEELKNNVKTSQLDALYSSINTNHNNYINLINSINDNWTKLFTKQLENDAKQQEQITELLIYKAKTEKINNDN